MNTLSDLAEKGSKDRKEWQKLKSLKNGSLSRLLTEEKEMSFSHSRDMHDDPKRKNGGD